VSNTFDEVTADGPEDLGQVDLVDGGEEQLGEVETEPELEFLDIDEFRDRAVLAKVDGEELPVKLSELVQGYQRQADYTRKTQELAQQKAELQWATAIRGALEHDPRGTIELLSQQFGVKPQAATPTEDPFDFASDSLWDEDPTAKRYQELDERLSRYEEIEAQRQLQTTLDLLSNKYGEDFDANEVVVAALQTGQTDLEAVYRQVAFDKIREKAQRAEAETAKLRQRTTAKRDAAVVEGGSSRRAGGDAGVEVGSITTIADAWRAAKQSHGIS
jgi:hypothetical protein